MEGVKYNDNKHKNIYGTMRRAGRVGWLYVAGFKIRREAEQCQFQFQINV